MEDEPFDFSTPITENTVLLAKWDCPEPGHTLDDLLTALTSGTAETEFPVNTQIDDYTNGSYDPWLVGHYGTQYGDSETTGVYLYRKYVHPVDMAWGSGDSYADSDINTYLNTTYLNSCSDAIKNAVAEINLPLVNGTTPAKMWLMSAAEVMGMSTGYAGGVAWDGWKERTELTSPSTQPNAGRVMAKGEIANGSGDAWRLRTEMENNSGEASVTFDGAIRAITSSVESGLVIACFVPKPLVPDKPDLSKVLTKEDLDDIQAIVAAGAASDKFNLGDELLVAYDTYTMPFEIVGFNDVEIEGGETVPAINLLAKYTAGPSSKWSTSAGTGYPASTLRSSITTYQGKLNADFLACLAKTKVQAYNYNDTTSIVYDKLFAPSMAQLGVTNTAYNNALQAAVEGPAFTAYQSANNAKRTKYVINATDYAGAYWTRSSYMGNASRRGCITTAGSADDYSYSADHYVAVACNFIAKSDSPTPQTYTVTFEADGATNIPAPQTVAGGGEYNRA